VGGGQFVVKAEWGAAGGEAEDGAGICADEGGGDARGYSGSFPRRRSDDNFHNANL